MYQPGMCDCLLSHRALISAYAVQLCAVCLSGGSQYARLLATAAGPVSGRHKVMARYLECEVLDTHCPLWCHLYPCNRRKRGFHGVSHWTQAIRAALLMRLSSMHILRCAVLAQKCKRDLCHPQRLGALPLCHLSTAAEHHIIPVGRPERFHIQ